MSSRPPKKRVVTTQDSAPKKTVATRSGRKAQPTVAAQPKEELIFGRTNYILMAAGAALVLLGLLLMTGGSMPSPDVWDPNIIYSARITILAPIVILLGLGVEIYAIFKR